MRMFHTAVLEVVRRIPEGEVMSYREVAEAAGRPGAARAVGRVLAGTDADVPWWRVVAADGSLRAPRRADQARRLKREGVKLSAGRVVELGGLR